MRFLGVLSIGILLSGCGSLLPQPGEPAKKILLTSLPKKGMPRHPTSHHQLIVEIPTVFAPLDNNRLALVPSDRQIDFYADVEWGDRLSTLIQETLLYSLQEQSGLKSVSRSPESIHADLSLKCDVRRFYIVHQGQNRYADVEYFAQLIRLPEREVIKSATFAEVISVPNETIAVVSEALNQANLKVIEKIVNWIP